MGPAVAPVEARQETIAAMHTVPTLSHRRLKEIASLDHRKYRERLGQFVVEGLRSVASAVAAGAPLVEVLRASSAREAPRVEALAAQAGVPVYVLSDAEMDRLSGVETGQGVLAVARIPLVPEEHLRACEAVLVLDGVQDPGNVGTILRTAAWFGADAVLTGPGTADLFNPKVVRSAMGGLWDLRLARSEDLAASLESLSRDGFACYGADLGGTPVRAWQPQRPSVLVLGSEAHGLSPAVRAALTERVAIPGSPSRAATESLNVAVAAGILLHEWLGRAG